MEWTCLHYLKSSAVISFYLENSKEIEDSVELLGDWIESFNWKSLGHGWHLLAGKVGKLASSLFLEEALGSPEFSWASK